jgi:hypothetical protein
MPPIVGVAPELTRSAEIVRRYAGNDRRRPVLIQPE